MMKQAALTLLQDFRTGALGRVMLDPVVLGEDQGR